MTLIRLPGCRSDSLLGYLKALGVLRLLSTQADRNARGGWDGATFVLQTTLSDQDVEAFFLAAYSPTPVVNPWNSGAGFDGKQDTAGSTLRRIRETEGKRWKAYREVLGFVFEHYVGTGVRQRYLDAGDKLGLIRDLRTCCPETLLPWLDSALVLMPDRVAFPYILGSGGNDGRLDFSVNFAARALDVCGDVPIGESRAFLRDAFQDSAESRLLPGAAIGQFSTRHVGGANAANAAAADSLVNPWDYVLLIEGSQFFAGSILCHTNRSAGRPAFPFALRGVAGAYGSASHEEGARGEVWLPAWNGWASSASIVDLFRKGRVDLPNGGERSTVQSAALASEGAAAIVTMGVPLGTSRFQRIAVLQRNGLAFSAVAIGTVNVEENYDQGIAVISHDLGSWAQRVRGATLGSAAREALLGFDEALFAIPNISERDPVSKARARQDILIAVADLDRSLARARSELREAPRLHADVLDGLDDGSALHRVAIAVASLGAARFDTDTRRELRTADDDSIDTLRNLLESRARADAKDRRAGWLRATCYVTADDAAAFLTFGEQERRRFNQLLRAYSLISLASAKVRPQPGSNDVSIPAAYALLKIVFDHPATRDERILRLLFSESAGRALALAVQRARTIRELPRSPRDVSLVRVDDTRWLGAALAIPIEPSSHNYTKVLNAALAAHAAGGAPSDIRAYLATIT